MTSGTAPTRLVGRRRESAALAAALDALGPRKPRFVAVSGEPGIGKTRLLDELAERAEQRDCLVLRGHAAELEDDLPFALWVDALDEHVAWLGADRLRRALGDRAGELAGVLPAAAAAAAAARALPDERVRTHRAVGSLLEAVAAPRPLVLLLDDVQWADGASLELLEHLLRRPPRAQLLLGVAFRPQLPAPLLAALAVAERQGELDRLSLGPLAPADVDALIDGELAATARDELHRVSGGNPFYLLELARSAGGRAPPAPAPREAGVPPAVAAALGAEIDALGPPGRLLAQGAAVAGDPVELELAVAAAGLDEPAALTALDEAVTAGILAPTGVAREYRFRHPIVRRAVYESAGEGWRLAAHGRVAAALSAHGGSLAAQAHHLERCARPGDEAALAVLIAAGHEAAARAPAGSVRWFGAALRLLPREDAQRRLELLVPFATALAAVGRLEQALAALLEALELVPVWLLDLRVRIVAACAACENLLGRHRAAHDRLLRALADLPDSVSAAAGALQAELAADALFDTDYAAMAEWADQARTTARALGDRGLNSVAAALLCFACYGQGELRAAERARAEAATALDELPDAELAARLDAPNYLGFAEFFCERYDDAIRHLRRGIEVARAAGQGQYLLPTMVGLAHALEVRGRLREGRDTAEAAVEGARLAGNRQLTSFALVAEGWIAAMAGDLPRARAAAEEAVELLHGLDDSVLTLAAHAHTAAIFYEAGEPGRCLEEAHIAGAPDLARIEPGRRAWLQAVLARAELARRRPEGAREWLARADAGLLGLDLPLAESAVLQARALVVLEGGDAAGAAELAERAAERADRVGAAIQAARCRALAGRAHGEAGARDAAVALLGRAEMELTACGAHRLRDEAARDLRRHGQRVAGRQRRGAAGDLGRLTGREREIAELVALGRTNREIAAELFLSEKTVEGHLTNVFAKLDVATRAAVGAAVGRADAPRSGV
ncbi:MAG TPA: AAA family ATPase [Solirubrobacteraceae bacterium]